MKTTRRRCRKAECLSLLCLLIYTTPAFSLTNSWIKSSDGSWQTGSNWSLGVAPTNTQNAILITNALSKTVTINAQAAVNYPETMTISNLVIQGVSTDTNTLYIFTSGTGVPLHVLNGLTLYGGGRLRVVNGALQVDGVGLSRFDIDGEVELDTLGIISATNYSSRVGNTGRGRLTILDGTMLAKDMIVATSPGSGGTLTVAGGTYSQSASLSIATLAGSTGLVQVVGGTMLVTNDIAIVGRRGVGELLVSNGTYRARDLYIGNLDAAHGTLRVARGTNSISSQLLISVTNTTTGVAWVTGGQLDVTNNLLAVGDAGLGQMTLSNGLVTANTFTVGHAAGSQGSFTMAGGTNLVTGSMFVGDAASSTGAVWMTGGQMLLSTNWSHRIGGSGVGQLTQTGGYISGGPLSVGRFAGSSGTLRLAGGTATFTGSFPIGSDAGATGTVWITGGRLLLPANQQQVHIGYSGVGQLITSNGYFLADSGIAGFYPGARGQVNIHGGTNEYLSFIHMGWGSSTVAAFQMTGGRLVAGSPTVQGTVSFGFGTNVLATAQLSGGEVEATRLFVGPTGTGTLTISGGSVLLRDGISVGRDAIGHGTIWMTGGTLVGTNLTFGNRVGRDGSGALIISNGVASFPSMALAYNPGGQGRLALAGGTLMIASNLLVGGAGCSATGIVEVTGGNLLVTNAAGNAVLEVGGGSVMLTGGQLAIDVLVITNECGRFYQYGGQLNITTAVELSPEMDADGDGLPNDWEHSHGLDTFNDTGPDGAAGDPDGDGQTNWEEYMAGTDSQSAASAFRILTITREGNDIRVSWLAGAGRTNIVQAATGNVTNTYLPVSPNIIIPGSSDVTTNYLEPGAATNSPPRFYRIKIVP